MKVAVSGKGGVGKTTLSAMLATALSLKGRRVVALDADPDANLAAALGLPPEEHPTPLSEMRDLIAERTGATGGYGGYFKLNPKVDDIPERFAARAGNIRLLALGGVKEGGGGCMCPATALVKALLAHLMIGRDDAVVMDMEAGIEHLGRATAQAMDGLLIVVNDTPWSLQTAQRVRKLAGDIGMKKLFAVVNRARPDTDTARLQEALSGIPLVGTVPEDGRFAEGVVATDAGGRLEPTPVFREHLAQVERLIEALEEHL